MPFYESGDPIESQAHDMQESPAHDLDCGTGVYATGAGLSLNCEGVNHFNFPPLSQNFYNRITPPLDSLLIVAGGCVFNPPNQNTSQISQYAFQCQSGLPSDFGLNESGNVFLLGPIPNTEGASGSPVYSNLVDQSNPVTLIASAVLNPQYIGPVVNSDGSVSPNPPVSVYYAILNGGQSLGFTSGSAVKVIRPESLPPGNYTVTVGASVIGAGTDSDGGPFHLGAVGVISVGGQVVCHLTSQGIAEIAPHPGTILPWPYGPTGSYQVTVTQGGVVVADLSSMEGALNFGIQKI